MCCRADTNINALRLRRRALIFRDLFSNNIGIKHGFSCINVCQVPREVLKTEAEGSLLLHNFNEMFGKICENMWHYILLTFDSQRLSAPVY